MSVLIKGMKMPKDCGSCQLRDSWICYAMGDNVIRFDKRDERCTLVEVPPHGRLIDADAVINLVMQYCPDDDGVCSKAGADLRKLLDEIENLPTVIPAEEGE